VKIWENSLKTLAKIVPNVFDLKKWLPTFAESHEDLILVILPKAGVHDFCRRKYSHNNLLGKFGESQAKIFSTPKNVPAPTLMASVKKFTS